jgi:ATP-dependent RNA helicase DDX24/MAK5
MDGRLLAAAQERANLAAKVVECDEVETKAQKSNKWFQVAAEEAGLDLDDDMIDEGLAGGDQRDQHKLREAKAARARLRQLLAQPMQTQRFGKFLSSNSAATEQGVEAYVVPLTHDRKKNKKRKGKRK